MKTYNILSIQEFKTIIGDNSRLLGIDPGKTNVGLAICDENKKVATPVKTIKKKKNSVGFNAAKALRGGATPKKNLVLGLFGLCFHQCFSFWLFCFQWF